MSATPEAFKETLQAISSDLMPANLFGKPCAKFEGGKPFLAFFQECMVYKLGAERCQEIMAENPECQPFDPSGSLRPPV